MIHAAAIRHNNIIYTLPKPARHPDIIAIIDDFRHVNASWGFMTDCGLFVDRETAARIAIDSNQITWLSCAPYLFTEDLW